MALYINNNVVLTKDTYDKEIKNTIKINRPHLQLTGVRFTNMYKLIAGSTVCIALNGATTGQAVLSVVKY